MTINELITELENYQNSYIILLGSMPILAIVYSFFLSNREPTVKPHNYVYSAIIHAVSFPGVCGIVLTCYTLFILSGNLLDVNFIVYFFPIIILIITVYIVNRIVKISDLPGIRRLTGLLIVLAVTFVLTMLMLKTRIFLFFGGSIKTFFGILLVLFAVLTWASHRFLGRKL